MNKTNFKLSVLALTACAFLFTGCEKDMYSDTPKDQGKTPFEFDFATCKNYSLDVNYGLQEGYEILFEVYSENPVDENGIKKADVYPLFKGMTSEGGRYNTSAHQNVISLPTYVKEVYLYSGAVGVPEVVKTAVTSQGISWSSAAGTQSYVMTKAGAATCPFRTLGDWNIAGIPDYFSGHTDIPASLMKDINYSLPKSKSVVDRHPEYLQKDIVTSIHIKTPTEVEITLTHTGASMKNTLGYFQYKTGEEPTSEASITEKTVIFPSLTSSLIGNGLEAGDKVKLKYWNGTSFENTFPAGVSIGWVMFVNAFQNGNVTAGQWRNYSVPALNIKENAEKQQHNVMLYDRESNIYVIAFEDQIRSNGVSDNDFHDAIFCIQTSNPNAIDNSNVADLDKWIDNDNDGVCDAEDEFPNDPNVAFSIHYPAKGVDGSLAFEDLWPSRGDYDLNDVVVYYHSIHFVNSYGRIARTEDRYDFVYSGAGLENGFGYQLGVTPSKVKKLDITAEFTGNNTSMFSFDSKGLEANQSKATIVLTGNVGKIVQSNTKRASCIVKTVFTSNITLNELTVPPYNPFTIVNSGAGKRDKEVHLPYAAPTDLASKSYFGIGDDRSIVSEGSYYLSYSYFPFAVHIPEQFAYPDEAVRIDVNYPEFIKWSESMGSANQDWYKHKQ